MAKDLSVVLLLDFYGGLLTDKQAFALDYYYNQDLSLSEIADDMGISRQGVMAFLKQGEKHLRSFEEKLGSISRFEKINIGLRDMAKVVSDIDDSGTKAKLIEMLNDISDCI